MVGIFQPFYEDLGLTQEAFEIALSSALVFLLLLNWKMNLKMLKAWGRHEKKKN
jgi:hypothetical protein